MTSPRDLSRSPKNRIPLELSVNATVPQTQKWLRRVGLTHVATIFENYRGSDMLRLTEEDAMQLCGELEGMRLYRALRKRPPIPQLTLYILTSAEEATQRAIYLSARTINTFVTNLTAVMNLSNLNDTLLRSIFLAESGRGWTLVTDKVLARMENKMTFTTEILKDTQGQISAIYLRYYTPKYT